MFFVKTTKICHRIKVKKCLLKKKFSAMKRKRKLPKKRNFGCGTV